VEERVHPVDRIGDEITTLAAHITAATARLLKLILEFERRGGVAFAGAKSLPHWLSYACGWSLGTAREHVRVARRLEELPLIAAAFERGELSYSKVRALTRVENVEDEEGMLDLARAAAASQLDRIVRGYQSVLQAEAELAHEERSLSWYWDDDGAFVINGRLPAEQGALLVKALEAARDALGPPPAESEDVPAGTLSRREVTPTQRRNADALIALAESSLADSGTADRYQVVVHVDADTLEAGADDTEAGRCELESGHQLPRATARRLACDSSLVRIIERDGEPLSVGHKTRSIPPAMRRALRSRDHGCCTFPGCTQTRHLDAHHLKHWADGGRTDLDNLTTLCRFHHTLLHKRGFSVERRDGALVFLRPDGRPLPHAPRPPRGDCTTLATTNQRRGINVSAGTPWPTDGGRFDLAGTVDGVLEMAPPPRRE
jgi:hypothetical protein